MYECYLSLEKYVFFGKCWMMFEKDKVKKMYYIFFQEDISIVKVFGERVVEVMDGFCLFEGWVLKIVKNLVCFNGV